MVLEKFWMVLSIAINHPYKLSTPIIRELLKALDTPCNLIVKMSVVPQSALAVCKVRQNDEKLRKGYDRSDCKIDQNPMKYSSKFMNSIWGMYNRYSVHNLKKNFDLTQTTNANQESKTSSRSQVATSAVLTVFETM